MHARQARGDRSERATDLDLRPRAPRPGQWIGERYLAMRQLGAGGMGTVWEVEHQKLGGRFALKLLLDPHATEGPNVARFHREVRAAAAIDHANVVRVVDYGEDPVLGPYLVMELLLGETLASVIEEPRALTLGETVEWIAPVAHALDAIHEGDLVHRDVKPENIVRAHHDAGTIVKLVDFGLAVHADGRDRVTRKGALVGTPHYMAPEVAEGGAATPASDVYSLAVVAFELLTARPPHDGDTPLEVVAAKLTTPPPSLAESAGRMFTIPLESAFAEALDLDPAARPPSATAFARRLAMCQRR